MLFDFWPKLILMWHAELRLPHPIWRSFLLSWVWMVGVIVELLDCLTEWERLEWTRWRRKNELIFSLKRCLEHIQAPVYCTVLKNCLLMGPVMLPLVFHWLKRQTWSKVINWEQWLSFVTIIWNNLLIWLIEDVWLFCSLVKILIIS